MAEIGIPVDIDSFNIYTLGLQAPQLPTLSVPDFDATDEEKVCWISWWCPDLPGDAVARAITTGVIVIYNFVAFVLNAVLWGATVVVLLIVNFLVLFNFASWAVFQGDIFLVLFGIGLTVLLGGTAALWVISKVMGSIPFVGGV